jgi:hypothetical protein
VTPDQTSPDQASARRAELFDLLRKQRLQPAAGRSPANAGTSGAGSLEGARLRRKAAVTDTADARAVRTNDASDAFALKAFRDQAIASLHPPSATHPVSMAGNG